MCVLVYMYVYININCVCCLLLTLSLCVSLYHSLSLSHSLYCISLLTFLSLSLSFCITATTSPAPSLYLCYCVSPLRVCLYCSRSSLSLIAFVLQFLFPYYHNTFFIIHLLLFSPFPSSGYCLFLPLSHPDYTLSLRKHNFHSPSLNSNVILIT